MADLRRILNSADSTVLGGAVFSLMVRGVDVPARYGFHVLVAVLLGPGDAGVFYGCFAIATMVAGFGRVGIDHAGMRAIARADADRDACTGARAGAATDVLRTTLTLSLAATTGLAGLVGLGGFGLVRAGVADPRAVAVLGVMMIGMVPMNAGVMVAGALAGLGRYGAAQAILSPTWPALWCLGALALPASLTGAAWLFVAATTATAFAALVLARPSLGRPGRPRPADRSPRALARLGRALFTPELTQLVIGQVPVAILAVTVETAAVGAFTFALRLATLVTVVAAAINLVAAPTLAARHAAGTPLGPVVRSLNRLVALVVLPVLALFAIAPAMVLGLAGAGFDAGADSLRLLALAQIAPSLLATAPAVLGMTGHEAVVRLINLAGAGAVVFGCAIASPFAGPDGCAAVVGAVWTLTALASARAVAARTGLSLPRQFVAGAPVGAAVDRAIDSADPGVADQSDAPAPGPDRSTAR